MDSSQGRVDDEEELEEQLLACALVMSHRVNDDVIKPLPYDLFHDCDYTCADKDKSDSDELKALATFFTQMMQMGRETLDNDDDMSEDDHSDDEKEIEEDEDSDGDEEMIASGTANAMHYAVFNCDVNAVMKLLDEEAKRNPQDYSNPFAPFHHSMDSVDSCGNTPLLLAIKLGYVELAKLLIAEGFHCDISSSSHVIEDLSKGENFAMVYEGPEFHLLDECVLLGNVSLIKSVYKQLQRDSYSLWLKKKESVLNSLLKIPDFYVELTWEFMGSGLIAPLVKMFAPYDTYRIWKKGNWLRLDCTIDAIHMNNFKVERSFQSLIFQGSSATSCVAAIGEGDLFLLNRDNNTYERVFRRYSDPSDLEMELFARKMIEIHKANKGLFNGDKGNTNNSQMRVNSLDMDAHGWTVRAVNDRKGAPKMIRLQCERNRDTLADIYNSRDTDRNVSAMTFDDHHESRLCYKWIASGQIKATVSSKSNLDTKALSHISAESYFNAKKEDCCALDGENSPLHPSWSSKFRRQSNEKKKRRVPKSREVKRKVEAAIFMVEDYPIALSELMPVLDIFAMKNDYLKKLVEIFDGSVGANDDLSKHKQEHCRANDDKKKMFLGIPPELFPYRIQVPIILGVSALATFENFKRSPDIHEDIFSIDTRNYTEVNGS